ncbi:MAG: tetratricopeptide repeat protein [Planctomycetota bacterium]|jgi:Tfp pilus assembly protein PilF
MDPKTDGDNQLSRKQLWIAIAIFALALMVRCVYLYGASPSPTFLAPTLDSFEYDRLARTLANGKGMEPGFFWQAFFYPLYLSIAYLSTHGSIVQAKLIQVVLGSGLCVLVYRLGEKAFDRRTGILAGVITALYGPMVFFESELLATGWASIWSVVLIILLLKAREGKGRRVYLVLGICGGLSIITRATFLPFFVVAGVWLAIALRRSSIRWLMVIEKELLVLLGTLLIVGPVAILCFRMTGRFSALPASGPVNLYMGNNSEKAEIMAFRPGVDWENVLFLPRQHGAKNAHQEYQFFIRRVRNYILTEPLHFLVRLGRKTVHFFSSREIPSNFDLYAARKYSRLFSMLIWKRHGFGFPFGVLLPLMFLGLVYHWRQTPISIILFLVLYPSAIILVFVTARYRAAMIPIMALPAAVGFWDVFEAIKLKRRRRTAMMTVVIAGVAVLSSLGGPFGAEKINYEAEMYYCLGYRNQQLGRPKEAIPFLHKALQVDPLYCDANHLLGYLLYQQGKPKEAIEFFNKALEINPEYYSAHTNLGLVFCQLGKVEEGVEHFNKALKINPKSSLVRYSLAQALAQLGRVDEAAEQFRITLSYAEELEDEAAAAIIKNKLKSLEPLKLDLDEFVPSTPKSPREQP